MNLSRLPSKRRGSESIIEPLEKRIAPAFTATLSGTVATFTGDGASDTLVIGESGGNLAHNRFTAGDLGYADDLDFNTSVVGSQRLTSGNTDIVNVTGGAGTDNVTITVATRLTVGSINVSGTVTLTASGTDIVDGNGAAVNVTAPRLVFFAGGSVGIGGNGGPIETQVSNLEVSAGDSVSINNGVTTAVGLTIGGVTATAAGVRTTAGDINLTNSGGVTISTNGEIIKGPGLVQLQALGLSSNLLLGGGNTGVNGAIVSTGGSVAIVATQDVLVGNNAGAGTAADINSAGDILISANRDLILNENSSVTAGQGGVAGDITVNVTRNVSLIPTHFPGADITAAGSGNVSVTTGSGGIFNLGSGVGGTVSSVGGSVTITADDMTILRPISAPGQNVTLQQATLSRSVSVGLDNLNFLGLSDTELDQVTAGNLTIGAGTNAGGVFLLGPTTPANVSNVTLRGGLIGDFTQTEQADMTVATLTLSTLGDIGGPGVDDIDISVTTVSASTNGAVGSDIFIQERSAGVFVDQINAGAANVTLLNSSGVITSVNPNDGVPEIIGDVVTINATGASNGNTGQIGFFLSSAQFFEVDANTLNASTNNSRLWIRDVDTATAGMAIGSVFAGTNTAFIQVLNGPLTSATVDGTADIVAATVNLRALLGGNLGGSADSPLEIDAVTLDASVQGPGDLHVLDVAGGMQVTLALAPLGNVSLESAGDLKLVGVNASGLVTLEATAGGSINGTIGGPEDVDGDQLAILGAANVGASAVLETVVTVLAATNIPGSTSITNNSSLATGTVAGITGITFGTSGAINANGRFTVSDPITGLGAIILGTSPRVIADDLIVTVSGSVTSTGGAITLSSVDGIQLDGLVTASASSDVTLSGDATDADAAGSTITITAPISAARTLINTGAQNDLITIAAPSAQAQSPLVIDGGAGDDNVTVTNQVITGGATAGLIVFNVETLVVATSTFSANAGPGVQLTDVGSATLTEVIASANGSAGISAARFTTLTIDRLTASESLFGAVSISTGGTLNIIAPEIASPTFGGLISDVATVNFTPSTGAVADQVAISPFGFGLVGGYSFSSLNVGTVNVITGDGDDEFSVSGLIGFFGPLTNLEAGDGDDVVHFSFDGSLFGGAVNGGPGTDTLDYSAFGSPAVVNLSDDALLQASLDATQVVPATTSRAFGSATMFFDPTSGTFDLSLDAFGIPLANLSGANIRLGNFGGNGAPVFDLDPSAFSQLANSGVARDVAAAAFPAANSAALLAGGTYLNLETTDFPNGEIRGQLFLKANARTASGTGLLSGIERAVGSAAPDLFVGGDGTDTFEGGVGNDELLGRGGADVLDGGAGNDKLNGGDVDAAVDSILGGAGSDLYVARRLAGTATLTNDGLTSASAGNDTFSSIEMAILTGDPGPNTLDASRFTRGAVALAGGGGTDTLLVTPFTPRISIGDGFAREPATGTATATFPVTLSAPTFDFVEVTAATSDGTAKVSTNDYSSLTATLLFRPLETSTIAEVTVQSDAEIEPNESFFVTLSAPSNATLGDAEAIGVIVAPLRIVNGTTAVFNDVDGDLITIRTNKGAFELADFTSVAAGLAGFQLQQINFTDDGSEFAGANLKITAKRDPLLGGDSFVNVGFLNAAGIDLGSVKIAGDLAIIAAGDASLASPGLRSLSVHSMGLFGTTTVGNPFTPLVSPITGDLGKLSVKTAIQGVAIGVSGKVGSIASGSLTNAAILVNGAPNPANPAAALAIKTIKIAGDMSNSRILAGHALAGPASPASGANADVQIGKVTVGGNWISSDLVAGIDSSDGVFGDDNDAPIGGGGSAAIASRIAKVIIKGQAFSTLSSNGIVAEELGSVKIGGAKLPLSKTAKDNIPVGPSGTFHVREV